LSLDEFSAQFIAWTEGIEGRALEDEVWE
jgi:hypothetical protein